MGDNLPPESENLASDALRRIDTSMRTCACGCGQTFEPKRSWQIYYSKKCRREGNKKKHQIDRERITLAQKFLDEVKRILASL